VRPATEIFLAPLSSTISCRSAAPCCLPSPSFCADLGNRIAPSLYGTGRYTRRLFLLPLSRPVRGGRIGSIAGRLPFLDGCGTVFLPISPCRYLYTFLHHQFFFFSRGRKWNSCGRSRSVLPSQQAPAIHFFPFLGGKAAQASLSVSSMTPSKRGFFPRP